MKCTPALNLVFWEGAALPKARDVLMPFAESELT